MKKIFLIAAIALFAVACSDKEPSHNARRAVLFESGEVVYPNMDTTIYGYGDTVSVDYYQYHVRGYAPGGEACCENTIKGVVIQ